MGKSKVQFVGIFGHVIEFDLLANIVLAFEGEHVLIAEAAKDIVDVLPPELIIVVDSDEAHGVPPINFCPLQQIGLRSCYPLLELASTLVRHPGSLQTLH